MFEVKCIKCNEEDSVCLILHDTDSFHCSSCQEEFTVDEVNETIEQWKAVLAAVKRFKDKGK